MSLQQISHDELQQLITQLDQALYNHAQWHKELIRTLVCRLSCDRHDILPEAYKECRFGQWYYSPKPDDISRHLGFIATGEAHKRMHELAGQLLIQASEKNTINPLDYDHFSNALEQLRLELATLKHESESLLYNRDPLTGAINRINMLPLLRERQEAVKRLSQPCYIAMLDIDFFKKVNDKYGHVIGDRVLGTLSHCIIEHLRPYDKVFRYGGEEFLLCIQDTDLQAGYDILERLREDISLLELNVSHPKPLHITVSIGLTLLSATLPIEDSIIQADQAMYLAKSAGRNRVEMAVSPSIEEMK
jgi:diguanylate cyclase (GGDEF)-like protein